MRDRRSPRDGDVTRSELIEAAGRLFAEEGVEGVSIRAVNSAAGHGAASVHYHFGSKQGLIEAVLEADGRPVRERIIETADGLLARSRRPNPREVLGTLATAYLELLERDPERGVRWLKVVAQLLLANDPTLVHASGESTTWLMQLAQKAFPGSAQEDVASRLEVAATSLVLLMARLPQDVVKDGEQRAAAVEVLLDFAAGGLDKALRQAARARIDAA